MRVRIYERRGRAEHNIWSGVMVTAPRQPLARAAVPAGASGAADVQELPGCSAFLSDPGARGDC